MPKTFDGSWEQRAVDEIIEDEVFTIPFGNPGDNDCYGVSYSSSGMCPCCGVELDTMTDHQSLTGEGYFQLCNSCGWESDTVYDD